MIFDENTVNDTISLGSNGSNPMFSSCPLDTVYIGRRLLYSTESSAGYSPFYENATLRSVHYGNREVAIYPKEYMNCTNLQNVLIGSGINIIDDEAFQNCTSLPTILIPNTVDKPLGASSFKNCSALYKAVIGDSVASIKEAAFESCVSLVDVKVGARVSDIYASAFKNCSSLPQITIPQATNSIKDYVFDDCAKLKYFFLEDGPNAISLGKNAATESTNVIGSECPLFYDCALDSIYLGRNLSYSLNLEDGYSPFYFNKTLRAVVIGDQATSVHENEFYKCQKLKYVSVGNGVTAIGNWAFSGCISLDHFLFGEGLETIGKEAFSDCTAVTKIVGNRPVPPVCGEQALVDINVFNCTLYVPTASVSAYQAAEQWKDFFFVEGAEKTYTLQYVIDGEVYATYSLVEGAAIEQPTAPTRDGYTFDGWSEIPATMPANDVTITGSFSATTPRTIIYKVDGEVYATQEIEVGSEITPVDAPEKALYEFVEWTGLPAAMPAENIEVVASYKQVAVSITINKYGSATYASPFALDFSEVSGLTAYAATGYNTYTGIITMTNVNTAQEGVGLFLKGTANTTYVVPILDETGDNTLNLMVGVLTKTTVNQTTDDGLYVNFKYTVLSGSTTPMFYRYSDGSSVSAGKAYLQLPQSWLPSDASFAIGIRFEDGFATDIDEITDNSEQSTEIYDLNGLRVLEPVKGVVYIVNGKKVIF